MENTIMKKLIIFTGILLAIAATGCKKSGLGDDPVAGTDTREDISFGSVVINKAFSGESATTFTNGFSFTVNDLLKSGASESAHIDKDAITYGASTKTWTYDSKKTYQWKEGTHTFFGWSKSDGTLDAKTFWGSEPELSGRTLTLPTKVLTTADNDQFDFLYSDIYHTTAADWKSSHDKEATVPLAFNHLFSAVSMTLENVIDGKSVTIESVTLKSTFKNSGSAVITFGDPEAKGDAATKVTVDPTADVSETQYIAATAIAETALASGSKIDVLAQKVLTGTDSPMFGLVWPQTFDGNGKELEVVYKREGDSESTASTISIPAITWESGMKYKYNLQIINKSITLTFNVADWETVEGVGNVDTSTGSINMSNVTWMNAKVMVDGVEKNTLDNDNESVTMYKVDGSYKHVIYETYEEDVVDEETEEVIHKAGDVKVYEEDVVDEETGEIHKAGDPIVKIEDVAYAYQPAQGYFTVNYPRTGKYFIAIIPAKGETVVDASKYQIMIYDSKTKSWRDYDAVNGEDVTNDTIYFRIFAASGQDDAEHKAQIDIWFQPVAGGEKISAYSEIRANYTLIIPAS